MATEEIKQEKSPLDQTADIASGASIIEEVARDIEQATDKTEPAQAEPAAEHTLVTVEDSVREAGVEPIENAVEGLHQAAQAVGGAVIGSETPSHNLTGENVSLNPKNELPQVGILHPLEGAPKGDISNGNVWKFVTSRLHLFKEKSQTEKQELPKAA